MTAATTIDLYKVLRSMLLTLLPTAQVIRGLGNDVPMPVDPFITITLTGQRRLSTNSHKYVDPISTVGTVDNRQAIAVEFQVDCFGPESADWAISISSVWRDQYATDLFRQIDAAPLYADNPRMMPFDNSMQNYEQRWITLLTLQFNPSTITPMYFFDNLPVTLLEY